MINLSKNEIERHFEKHKLNINKEKMHSVFNINLSLDEVEQYIKYMNKTGIKELYDVYQIYWPGIGNMVIDEGETKKEDYLTIYTLPFTKKIMMCYPDSKFDGVIINEPVSIDELKCNIKEENTNEIIETQDYKENESVTAKTNNNSFDKTKKAQISSSLYVDEDKNVSKNYKDDNGEVSFIPKDIEIPSISDFSKNKDSFRVLINLLPNPTEQVVLLLSFGYVENKYYTVEEVAKALCMKKQKVEEILNQALTNVSSLSVVTTNCVESARKILALNK